MIKHLPDWVKNLLLVFASLLIITGVLEISSAILLRYFNRVPYNTYLVHDPTLGWKLAPNLWLRIRSHAKHFDFECKINSAGFREDDQGMLDPQDCDVVIIGDSHVFGYGLVAEETLANQLARILSVGRAPVKVLNAGVPGYGIDQFYLRLMDVGPLKAGTRVIIVIHARNDCVNTCNDVDYRAYKPEARIRQDSVAFSEIPYANPRCEFHFASQFDRLNRVFKLKVPGKPSWLDQLTLKSDLIYFLGNFRRLTIAKLPEQAQEVVWDRKTPEEYTQFRLQKVQHNPLSLTMRMWPEIKQFDAERQRMIELVGFLLKEIDEHVSSMQCKLIIVVAPDAARLQASYKILTDTLQANLSNYQFDWGWTERALCQKLMELKIPSIQPQYPAGDMESMFVPLDGHTSGKAFGLIARLIAEDRF